MISYITGQIIDLDFTSVTILTAGGVGYNIGINELTYSRLSSKKETSLYIYHHITELSQSLFGFVEREEKKVFTELIKISGIGGKVAMQILAIGIERLITAINSQDNKTIEGLKGIGKKMAEKIILELKDKDFGITIDTQSGVLRKNLIPSDLSSSIKSTLTNMGYNPRDVDRLLGELPEGMSDAGNIIPHIIKLLS